MSTELTPTSKKFLSLIPKGVDFTKLTIQDIRNSRSPVVLNESIPRPEVTIQTIEIPANDDGHPIPVDVYRPANVDKDEILPALVYL